MGRSAQCALAAAAIYTVTAWAQANLPQTTAPSRLITLNVVAVDNKGNPVEDLASSNFHLLEGGKPQQIDFFRHRESRLQQTAPNDVSNRASGSFGHTTLILFDLLNQHLDARGPAWNDLIHALQPLESSDGLYLYLLTMDAKLYPVYGLPNPEKDIGAPPTAPWTRQIKPLLDQAMNAVFRTRLINIDIDTQVRLTYASLGSLAARMAAIPGRKNIVWITHGVPISLAPSNTLLQSIDYTQLLRDLSERLDRANVSIYPVQQIPPGMASQGTQEARYSGMGSQDTLQEFARYTGGPSNGSIDIRTAVHQAMNDARTSYQIGYYPTPANWDGKFHKVHVTCDRKGVRVQTKEGYYAWAEQPFAEQDQRDAIDAAVSAQFDTAEIGLRATLSRDAKNARATRLHLRIEPADVSLVRDGSRYSGHLMIKEATFKADGGAGPSKTLAINLRLTPEQHEGVMNAGVTVSDDLELAEGVQSLRVVVLDSTSNAIGSITIPVSQHMNGQ